MSRKELYKNSLKKAGHAWKIILEKGLTGTFVSQSSLLEYVWWVSNPKELETSYCYDHAFCTYEGGLTWVFCPLCSC
jgi:hypothetical protein